MIIARVITGSPSSKCEHRRASALLRNIQNIRICKKNNRFCNLRNERISIKNSLPYLKCVLRLSCVVHGPIYGRFMGFYVDGFLSINRLHNFVPFFHTPRAGQGRVGVLNELFFWEAPSRGLTQGTRGFSRERREFSVLAEGRHIFGRRIFGRVTIKT